MTDPYRLLVIEDSIFIRYLLEKYLQELDMVVVKGYGTPDEGIAGFEKLKPDITLIDYSLPGMNGIQVAEAILMKNIHASLVMLLPTRMLAKAPELIGMGIKGVIGKPFYPEKLQSTMIEVAVSL